MIISTLDLFGRKVLIPIDKIKFVDYINYQVQIHFDSHEIVKLEKDITIEQIEKFMNEGGTGDANALSAMSQGEDEIETESALSLLNNYFSNQNYLYCNVPKNENSLEVVNAILDAGDYVRMYIQSQTFTPVVDIADLNIATHTRLQYLYLNSNSGLNGVVPIEWGAIEKLRYVNVANLGLTELEVDEFLVSFLAAINEGMGSDISSGKKLYINGTNSSRGAAGQTAEGLIESKGWTVY